MYTEDESGRLSGFNLMGDDGNIIATSCRTEASERWHLYNKDVRGSTSSLLDSTGVVSAAYLYDDFGETTTTVGDDFDNEVCYTGQVYDRNTGLYYCNARFYAPGTSRFISQDTYRGEETKPESLNLYAYCANDPINCVDPSGFAWETVLDVVSAAWSVKQFAKNPSWINAGYLFWDIGSACLPFIPGSYVVKASKLIKGKKTVTKIKGEVPTTVGELQKKKSLTVGKYSAMLKIFRNYTRRSEIEIHHIIEKRFAPVIKKSPKWWPSVAMSKPVHKKITKRFKKAYDYNYFGNPHHYDLKENKLRSIVNEVYYDMPTLKKTANKQIDRQYVPADKNPLYKKK